ncbi:MAG: nuclear transport factor 2 family protein [Gammaproteobacteria bacterium]|jgi:ketosteroid isomerase-like protein
MERQDYIVTVESYFAALDAGRLDEVLSYFNVDATFTVQTAFTTFTGRDAEIRGLFEQFISAYENILHTDFEHIVDPSGQAISSRFRVELDNKVGGHETKQSVNQWYFENGKFQRVYTWIGGENVLGT